MCCKIAGDFRKSRNRAAKLQETFASRETAPQSCRRLSQVAKPRRKVAGNFRKSRNRAAKLQETFAKLSIPSGNASD